MRAHTLNVRTGDRLVTDLTREAEAFVDGLGDGLLNVFVPHATAGLAMIETGAGSEPDLADALERLLPTADIYRHRHGSTGHGRDHVVPVFVAPSLTVPVLGGRLALGTWQSVVLVDPNADNVDRRVLLSFIEGGD
ncbi:MAG: YjbQ family protein [Candidatus Nanopelagicales bacterium]